MIYASCVVLNADDYEIIETTTWTEKQNFPYISGLLGFREAPACIRTFELLSIKPDLIMVDGQGIAHPRGLGIASHIGVLLDIPTIGVAKSILTGKPEGELGEEIGSTVPLIKNGKEIGRMLRTKKNCLPLIVSPGHRISMDTAIALVLNGLKGYKLPEPTRRAHLAANFCRVSGKSA